MSRGRGHRAIELTWAESLRYRYGRFGAHAHAFRRADHAHSRQGMKIMEQSTRNRMLSLDTIQVETFEPQPAAERQVVGPPTNPGASVPPCCSEVYICR